MIKEKLRDVTNKIWDRNRKKINKKYRSELKNKDFTIFSCNCTGGVLYHDLGMKFLSPTINLYMSCDDFIKFCENPKKYLSFEMKEYNGNIVREYPLAQLGDLILYLVHYNSVDEASQKWNERKQRINWDNIFVIGTNRDGFNDELSRRFDALPYPKILFTNLPDSNPNHFYIKGYENENMVGTIVEHTDRISGKRVYDQFDWISFLNGKTN